MSNGSWDRSIALVTGDARAAMFLGLTFDPNFLDRANARGLHGDIAQAATWYRRAREVLVRHLVQSGPDVEQGVYATL